MNPPLMATDYAVASQWGIVVSSDRSPQMPAKKRPVKPVDLSKAEIDPKAWPRFEVLVKSAAKMGHKPHKPAKKKAKRRD